MKVAVPLPFSIHHLPLPRLSIIHLLEKKKINVYSHKLKRKKGTAIMKSEAVRERKSMGIRAQ